MRVAQRAAVLLVPVVVWIALVSLHSEPRVEGTFSFAVADFVASSAATPPPEDWTPRSLPDDWREAKAATRDGWYRFHFLLDAVDAEPWAVYLPKVAMNARVFLNGEPSGDGGRFEEPVARNWNRPLLFRIPRDLLHRGDNALHVRVRSDLVDNGFLGEVHVGPERVLAPHARRSHAIRVTAIRVFSVLRVATAFFMAMLWAQRRSEPYYGWFALFLLAWAMADLNHLVVDIPVATMAWYWLWLVGVGWWAVAGARFMLSFIGDRRPRVERALLLLGVGGPAILALVAAFAPERLLSLGSPPWLSLAFLAPIYAVVRVIRVGNLDEVQVATTWIVGVSILGAVLPDFLADTGLRSRNLANLTPYTSPLVVFGMGGIVLRRFVSALRESEALVETLEERVRAKRAELEQSHERAREMERERLLAEERERIMSDVNDGLGSRLVSALAMSRHGAAPPLVATEVRAALADLRLLIDSLEPIEGDLLAALGQLRLRLAPAIEAAGIAVDWRVESLPRLVDLGPHKLLSILRVLADAIIAVVEKDGARTITVRTGLADQQSPGGAVFVEITDDAGGSPRPPTESSRRRAREIGGAIEVEGSGTFRLWIPGGRVAT